MMNNETREGDLEEAIVHGSGMICSALNVEPEMFDSDSFSEGENFKRIFELAAKAIKLSGATIDEETGELSFSPKRKIIQISQVVHGRHQTVTTTAVCDDGSILASDDFGPWYNLDQHIPQARGGN